MPEPTAGRLLAEHDSNDGAALFPFDDVPA
jgi:hypothetical protein